MPLGRLVETPSAEGRTQPIRLARSFATTHRGLGSPACSGAWSGRAQGVVSPAYLGARTLRRMSIIDKIKQWFGMGKKKS
jgi:hypothetical protein